MQVDREPLLKIEEFDENLGARPVAGNMIWAEPCGRVLVDRLDEESPVRQPTEALGSLSEARRRRPDPLLGPLRTARPTPQCADAITTTVEVVELVHRQQDR